MMREINQTILSVTLILPNYFYVNIRVALIANKRVNNMFNKITKI